MRNISKHIRQALTTACSLTLLAVGCKDKIVSDEETASNFHPEYESPLYNFTMKDIDGNNVSLSEYKDKVILIVNVASKCGLTPQYESLQTLYSKYSDKGFVILGFPANNFLSQEPGTNAEIKEFCTLKYEVTFPMFAKISVKGNDIHPLYKYLTQKELNGVLDAPVTWNFQKFLINRKGQLVASFNPKTTVIEKDFLDILEKNLKEI